MSQTAAPSMHPAAEAGQANLPSPSPNDVFIAVMGLTGSGKSSLINLITQSSNPLEVGHDITACTQAMTMAEPFCLGDRRVIMFDTPGFDDTNKSEQEVLRMIALILESTYRAGVKFHGIIYLHRISDNRVGGMAKKNFRIFQAICGNKSLRNVTIATTMWSRVTAEEGHRRVSQLETLDGYFKPALSKGAKMVHLKDDTLESARNVIRDIIANHPLPLGIQEELVDEGKGIDDTSATEEINKEIAALKAELQKELEEHIEAMEHEREEDRKEAEAEAQRTRAHIARLEANEKEHAEKYRILEQRLRDAESKSSLLDHLGNIIGIAAGLHSLGRKNP